MKAQVEHLLDYLLAVEELKQTAPRQIPGEWLALHQVDLKGLDGIHFNLRVGDQDVWLRVERLEETPPPQPKPALSPWVQLTRTPNTEPSLRSSILVANATKDKAETVMLNSRPDLRPLFEAYPPDSQKRAVELPIPPPSPAPPAGTTEAPLHCLKEIHL